MGSATLNQLLLDSIRKWNRADLLWHKAGGAWQKISAETFLRRVAAVAWGLREFGIQKGDRVAVFSENRPEWAAADLAILGLGAWNVPIYQNESPERLEYILGDSEARVCFLSGAEQFEKVKRLWARLPKLEKVVPFTRMAGGEKVVPWEALAREDFPAGMVEEFERGARAHRPEDPATLIYTSGTTGTPKGALLTQHNLASNVEAVLAVFGYGEEDIGMSVLPLCHIYQRTTDYSYFVGGLAIVYAESFDKLADNLREVRPTVISLVPRFLEKFNEKIQERAQAGSWLRRALFRWAEGIGRRATPYRIAGKLLPAGLALAYRLADALVFAKLRAAFGGRLRCINSGSAPLSKHLNETLHALGFTIYEGYGLTETSPGITGNSPGAVKLGTVGRPFPGVQIKIAEDGEILTRGPHVMKGYYKMEKETAEVMRDGWFCTGDLGALDPDGFLTITGRKKELLKTSGGKYIAPAPLEHELKASPYVANAMVIGDGRKFAAALLVPNLAALEKWAKAQGMRAGSAAELLTHPRVRELIGAEVDKVNAHLAQYERIKKFALLERDFSYQESELTYTQKLRRPVIEQRHAALIAALYGGEARADP